MTLLEAYCIGYRAARRGFSIIPFWWDPIALHEWRMGFLDCFEDRTFRTSRRDEPEITLVKERAR